MFRRAGAALAVAVVLIAGGCVGVDDQQATEDLDALQERVVAEMEGAVVAVEEAGLTVEEAAGVAEYCQLQPDPGVTYRAGGKVAVDDEPAVQVATISDALSELGWEVEREGEDPEPYATLTRDDLRASVSVSRRVDEPGVTFGITGPCLSVPDDFTLKDNDRRTDLTPKP